MSRASQRPSEITTSSEARVLTSALDKRVLSDRENRLLTTVTAVLVERLLTTVAMKLLISTAGVVVRVV